MRSKWWWRWPGTDPTKRASAFVTFPGSVRCVPGGGAVHSVSKRHMQCNKNQRTESSGPDVLPKAASVPGWHRGLPLQLAANKHLARSINAVAKELPMQTVTTIGLDIAKSVFRTCRG